MFGMGVILSLTGRSVSYTIARPIETARERQLTEVQDLERTGNKRTAAAARTRRKLIETGLRLAEELGLEGLSVNAVVAAAGVSKGAFFHHFGDRTAYLVALHRRFHDALADEIGSATADLAPGLERLSETARVYLDGCLRDRGVKALLLEARGHRPISDEVMQRNRRSVETVTTDFEAIGRRHPRQSARLWVAATAECALMELELGHADQEAREALDDFTSPEVIRHPR
jgi:TetR/AcrR family transcriptional repressor of nem operon